MIFILPSYIYTEKNVSKENQRNVLVALGTLEVEHVFYFFNMLMSGKKLLV